jgi:hypothetical protein
VAVAILFSRHFESPFVSSKHILTIKINRYEHLQTSSIQLFFFLLLANKHKHAESALLTTQQLLEASKASCKPF